MHARYDRERGSAGPSPKALEELARIFIERPSFDRTLPMFLGILRDDPNPEITRIAIDAFDTVMTHEVAPYWSDEVIDLLRDRLKSGSQAELPAPKPTAEDDLAEELEAMTEALYSPDVREAKFQRSWAQFKQAFNLTPKPRADYVKKPGSRTGGETPP